MAAATDPGRPRVLLSASAVGYYGDTGSRTVTEDDPPGEDFLAQVCAQWEAATAPAEDAGVRVVRLRTGLVLGRSAMLTQVLGTVFKVGLGGRMGSGEQYWPWISLADEVGAIRHLLTADVTGPVNLTGPAPVTNAEFTRELAAQVHRPAVLPVPGFAIKLASASSAGPAFSPASGPAGAPEEPASLHPPRPALGAAGGLTGA